MCGLGTIYAMIYLKECECDIFGDLNNVDLHFHDYDSCNRPHCPTHHTPRPQILLSIVKIIFGTLLKCVFVNEINDQNYN